MKRMVLILLFSGFIFSNQTFSAPFSLCDGTKQHPCVVIDTINDTPDVKHLRDSSMMVDAYKGNVVGLDQLWVSGSGAMSAMGWQAVVWHVAKLTQGKVKKIINVDLRQESHGFLNGRSINLTSEYNWINKGKATERALADEQQWLKELAQQTIITNVLTSDQFKKGELAQGINLSIDSLMDEETLTKQYGFDYVRLTVSDHMAPRHDDVDRFVNLIAHLPANTWLHLHCRGGNGRTTAFMAMYDMLKNANKVSFDDIILRQASVYPFYNLYDIAHNDPALTKYYKKRLAFLQRFYQYAQAHLSGYSGNWSDWIKTHS